MHIDDVPALGDWKTAWDHIAFDGFLGSRMVLQTIWQGCDSALAAPLVLDLARLLARAHEAGLTGPAAPSSASTSRTRTAGPPALAEQYAALTGFAGPAAGAVVSASASRPAAALRRRPVPARGRGRPWGVGRDGYGVAVPRTALEVAVVRAGDRCRCRRRRRSGR